MSVGTLESPSISPEKRRYHKTDYTRVNNLPKDAKGRAFTADDIEEYLKKDVGLRTTKAKDLWQAVAYVYASRLLRLVRTCGKKDISSLATKNLTLSAAIAYDKGFPKEDKTNGTHALVTYNNLFLGSDMGQKLQNTLTKALPTVQPTLDAELRSYTEVGKPKQKVILKD
jgi:hypothetical protein